MRLLGIDTSSKATGLCIFRYDGEDLQGEDNPTILLEEEGVIEGLSIIEQERTRAEEMLPKLASLLAEANLSFDDIDGIAVGIGPGSFTGIRIGVTIAKTIAQFTNKKLLGISTLEALSYTRLDKTSLIVPVIDARANRIYSAAYLADKDYEHGLKLLLEEDLYFEENLVVKIDELVNRFELPGIYYIGEGVYKHIPLYEQSKVPYELATGIETKSAVVEICKLAAYRYLREDFDSPLDLRPNYLRKSQAEMERERNGMQRN